MLNGGFVRARPERGTERKITTSDARPSRTAPRGAMQEGGEEGVASVALRAKAQEGPLREGGGPAGKGGGSEARVGGQERGDHALVLFVLHGARRVDERSPRLHEGGEGLQQLLLPAGLARDVGGAQPPADVGGAPHGGGAGAGGVPGNGVQPRPGRGPAGPRPRRR